MAAAGAAWLPRPHPAAPRVVALGPSCHFRHLTSTSDGGCPIPLWLLPHVPTHNSHADACRTCHSPHRRRARLALPLGGVVRVAPTAMPAGLHRVGVPSGAIIPPPVHCPPHLCAWQKSS